jgi:hypothetical protein
MREIKIRDAGEGDIEALADLMTELGYPTAVEEMGRRFEEISADPSYRTLLAERDGQVLGMTGLHGVRYTVRKNTHAHGYARARALAWRELDWPSPGRAGRASSSCCER